MEKRSLLQKIKTEYLGKGYATFCGLLIVVLTLSIIIFIATKGIQTFTVDHISLFKLLFSSDWKPGAATPQYGALIFIVGSTLVSIGAIIISAPISIALAIFMNLISPKFGDKFLKPSLELFAGIPSVVYGWVGVIVLVPFIRKAFGGVGFSLLTGILVLSIMVLPTIVSISSDTIKTMPHDYIEASYGLGATRWQTIYRVIIPACKNGILTSIVLGLARAFGEALAVQMVIGNTIKFPNGVTSPTITLTSVLTMDMANTSFNTPWNDALWSLAFLLLLMSFIFIVIIRFFGKRSNI
jgi:phosphate transport system permease protein